MTPIRKTLSKALPAGSLRFVITSGAESEDHLYRRAVNAIGERTLDFSKRSNTPGSLALSIKKQTELTLGEAFTVSEIRVSKGSTMITVLLGIFAVYEGFSRYENFIKSKRLLVEQITELLHNEFDEPLSIIKVKETWIEPEKDKQQHQVKPIQIKNQQ